MKILLVLAVLFMQSVAVAQTSGKKPVDLSYSYLELRYVDINLGGDGFRFNGSYELDGGWIIVGGVSRLDFDNNNGDKTTVEAGGGYVWHFSESFDLLSTLRFVRSDVGFAGLNAKDNGFAISAGARGLLAPRFELRGSVNYINLDNSDTFLELAGDYYFSKQFSAGVSLEFAGNEDVFTIGGRWFFR